MNPVQLISQKKTGQIHSFDEINWIIQNFNIGKVSEIQMAAWLMTINFNGLNLDETIAYTQSLLESGQKLEFCDNSNVIDKHSTGGVGDKVSFILGPILAALGYKIPMLAGRGLEHTGGTIDKLESISGIKTKMPLNSFKEIVNSSGLAIMRQTKEICPADGKIYSIRDKTATVNSLGLICGSILSKKIAEGISTLVLDIKVGNGAFMSKKSDAKSLGKLMQIVGEKFNLKVIPCYTDMSQPLGKTSGLWCEVNEAWEALNGKFSSDLKSVVFYLCQEIIGKTNYKKINKVIKDGTAAIKFQEMIFNQGGNQNVFINKSINDPKFKIEISSKQNGYINSFETKAIGFALAELGANKIFKDDSLDFSCGCEFFKKRTQRINFGDPIALVFGSNKSKVEIAAKKIKAAISIISKKPEQKNTILNLN